MELSEATARKLFDALQQMAAAAPRYDDERVFDVWPIFDEERIFDGEPIFDEDPNGLITESVDVFGSSAAPAYDDAFATSVCSAASSPSYDDDLLGAFGIFVPDREQPDGKQTAQPRFDTAPCTESDSEEARQSLLVVNHFLNPATAQALFADGVDHCFGEELDTDRTTEFRYCDGNHVGAKIRAHRTEACEGWDICQVVGHGVDAAPVADSFLELSPEDKLRFDMSGAMQSGLIASNHLQGKAVQDAGGVDSYFSYLVKVRDIRLIRFSSPLPDQALDLPIGKHVFDCASVDGKSCLRAHTPRSIAEEALEAVFPISRAQTLIALCGTIPGYWFTIALIAVDDHFDLIIRAMTQHLDSLPLVPYIDAAPFPASSILQLVVSAEEEEVLTSSPNRCLVNCFNLIQSCFSRDAVPHRQPWPPPHMHVEFGCDSADLRPIPWPSFTTVVHDSAVLMLWLKGAHVVATFCLRGVHELVQPLSVRVTDGQRYRPMTVDGAPKWMVIQYQGAPTCLQGVQPSVSTGAVVGLLLLSAASAAMVGMKIVAVGTESGANRVQLADKLKIFKTDNFDSDAYVQSKCRAMDEKEIRHMCSYLQDLKKASAEEMRRSVYSNYAAFIKTSKEIPDLEGELLSVRNLPSTQSALIHGLSEGVQIDSLATGPEGSAEQDISSVEDQEPSEIWKWSTDFPDMLDVLLAERRVDEALDRSLAVSTIIFSNFHDSIVWGYSGRAVPYYWFKSMFGWTGLKISVDQLVRQCPVFQQTQEEQQFPIGSLHPSYLSGYYFNSLYRYASETNRLGAADRYGVLGEAYALWMANKPQLVSLLHMISVYKGETEYAVLAHIATTSLHIDEMMDVAAPEELVSLRKFLIDFLEPFALKFGWYAKSDEGHLNARNGCTTMLRRTVWQLLQDFFNGKELGEDINLNELEFREVESIMICACLHEEEHVILWETPRLENWFCRTKLFLKVLIQRSEMSELSTWTDFHASKTRFFTIALLGDKQVLARGHMSWPMPDPDHDKGDSRLDTGAWRAYR